MSKYETDPLKIREKSSKSIRALSSLDHLSEYEQKVAIRMVQSFGDTSILEQLRISPSFIDRALEVLEDEDYEILCDSDSAVCNLKDKYLKNEPICLISKANVISQAKKNKKTRSMTAVDSWGSYLDDGIVLIGEEPTALFRLLEILKEKNDDKKPSLIIATPPGFEGAAESKQLLWEQYEKLDIPCLTLLGTQGGSVLASTALNTLLKIHQDQPKSADD